MYSHSTPSMFHEASPSSVFFFLVVCGVVVTAFLRGVWISAKPQGRNPFRLTLWVSLGLLLWLAAIAGLVGSGWLEAVPGRLIMLGGAVFTVSILLGLSPLGKWMATPAQSLGCLHFKVSARHWNWSSTHGFIKG